MEITGIKAFVNYWDRIHGRTKGLLPLIPEDRLEHNPIAQKFSFADLIRHIAAVERLMFVEIAIGGKNNYPGHGPELACGYQAVMDYYHNLHSESRELLLTLSNNDLEKND